MILFVRARMCCFFFIKYLFLFREMSKTANAFSRLTSHTKSIFKTPKKKNEIKFVQVDWIERDIDPPENPESQN